MIIFLIYKNIFYYNNYSDIFIDVVAYIPNDFVLELLFNIVIWSMGILLLTPLL